MFAVGFDLETKSFVSIVGKTSDSVVPLAGLLDSRTYLKRQSELVARGREDLLDCMITLYSSFQEYLIPCVTISGEDKEMVVEIFERVNRGGATLGEGI